MNFGAVLSYNPSLFADTEASVEAPFTVPSSVTCLFWNNQKQCYLLLTFYKVLSLILPLPQQFLSEASNSKLYIQCLQK